VPSLADATCFLVGERVLDWTREIRIAAGLVIIGFSGVLLLHPRHPRWLARVRPTKVTLWSFSVALLHGAGLMLAPMLLGLCAPSVQIPLARSIAEPELRWSRQRSSLGISPRSASA
jgi:hypothetical protein